MLLAGGWNCTSGSCPMASFHIAGVKPPGSSTIIWNYGILETAKLIMDGLLMSDP
jgi:hypothetical protein